MLCTDAPLWQGTMPRQSRILHLFALTCLQSALPSVQPGTSFFYNTPPHCRKVAGCLGIHLAGMNLISSITIQSQALDVAVHINVEIVMSREPKV